MKLLEERNGNLECGDLSPLFPARAKGADKSARSKVTSKLDIRKIFT